MFRNIYILISGMSIWRHVAV